MLKIAWTCLVENSKMLSWKFESVVPSIWASIGITVCFLDLGKTNIFLESEYWCFVFIPLRSWILRQIGLKRREAAPPGQRCLQSPARGEGCSLGQKRSTSIRASATATAAAFFYHRSSSPKPLWQLEQLHSRRSAFWVANPAPFSPAPSQCNARGSTFDGCAFSTTASF